LGPGKDKTNKKGGGRKGGARRRGRLILKGRNENQHWGGSCGDFPRGKSISRRRKGKNAEQTEHVSVDSFMDLGVGPVRRGE